MTKENTKLCDYSSQCEDDWNLLKDKSFIITIKGKHHADKGNASQKLTELLLNDGMQFNNSYKEQYEQYIDRVIRQDSS